MPNLNVGFFVMACAVYCEAVHAATWQDSCRIDDSTLETQAISQIGTGKINNSRLTGRVTMRCQESDTDNSGTYTISNDCVLIWTGMAGCSTKLAEYLSSADIDNQGRYCYCVMMVFNEQSINVYRWYNAAGTDSLIGNNSRCLSECATYCARALSPNTSTSGHMQNFFDYAIHQVNRQEI